MQKSINHIYLIIIISILSSVAPMAIDTYLPAIPEISSHFGVPIHLVELSLPIFLAGFAIGQIFGGPISDRYGRRIGSMVGLMGFSLFSFLIIFSTSVYELWLYRILEAFFGGITVVNAAAIVRDKFKGSEAAKVFSLVGLVRSLAPLLAPVFGSIIIHFYTWREVFIFLALYALVVVVMIYRSLPESYTYVKQSVLESYKTVLTHTQALKAMLTLAFSFGGFFIIISKSSFIYIEHFGISTDLFPLFFGVNFIVMMLLIKLNVKLLRSYSVLYITKGAILIQLFIALVFLFNHQNPSIYFIVVILSIYTGMMAFIFGNAMAMALEFFEKNAGVASGVIGVLQFGLGASVSSSALSFNDNGFFVISLSLVIVSLISFFAIRSYKGAKKA